MGVADLLLYAPLLVALFWAAVEDISFRRIRNALTFSLAATGLAQSFLTLHTVTPWDSLEGLGVGFALMILPFAVGALGGGDIKLVAAVGAWLGPLGTLNVFMAAAIVGLIVVLVQSACAGKLSALFWNSYLLAINLVHISELGVDHVAETGSTTTIDKPLPYAVPVFLATIAVLLGIGLQPGAL
ncbi:MAG TPA: A24 family peptidase [Tepidisphaeraceae bacterium]|nr:A24 family peptidase [Tepidisphaeraceae bacterium]